MVTQIIVGQINRNDRQQTDARDNDAYGRSSSLRQAVDERQSGLPFSVGHSVNYN